MSSPSEEQVRNALNQLKTTIEGHRDIFEDQETVDLADEVTDLLYMRYPPPVIDPRFH